MSDHSSGYWIFEGQDGINPIFFRRSVPAAGLDKDDVKEILRRLASRHLTCREILSASIPGVKISHLEIRDDTTGKRPHLTTVDSPYYMAAHQTEKTKPDVGDD